MSGDEATSGRIYQHERHQHILDRARANSRVEVTGLATALDVTTETIRRDLTALERQGLLRRVHGGAVLVERLGGEPSISMREERYATEKDRIGAAAVSLLPAGGSVILDGGTTTLALARQIPDDVELTVLTNSLPVATVLADRPNVDLHLLGGRIRSRTRVAVGSWAVTEMAGISADVAFLGTNGFTLAHGLTTPDMVEAEVKRVMARSARQLVLLSDHTKFGASYLCRFADLGQLDVVVTDDDLDDDAVDAISSVGPEVVRA